MDFIMTTESTTFHRRSIIFLSAFVFFTVSTVLSAEKENKDTMSDFFFQGDEKTVADSPVYDSAFDKSSGITEEDPESLWADPDISDSYPELQILDDISPKKSLERLKKARSLYSTAMKTMEKSKKEEEELKQKYLKKPANHDWEKRERQEAIEKEQARIRARHRMESIGYLIKGLDNLEMAKNPSVRESDTFVDLKSVIVREYIKLQFASRNLAHCIEMLNTYLRLKPEHTKQAEPYRLLAVCYRSQEVAAKKMGKEELEKDFKRLKNANLLKYAEIRYGKDSGEYNALKQQIDRDFTGSF